MERSIWEKVVGFVSVEKYPQLPCPYCKARSLTLDKESISYRKSECPKTKALINQNNQKQIEQVADVFESNPWMGVLAGLNTVISGTIHEPAKLIAFFKCEGCGMDVSSTGTCLYPAITNQYSREKYPLIKVEYFSPPIPIFDIDPAVPESIKSELLQAFNHYHSDLNSSGTKLRRAIEKLCHELGFREKNLHRSLSSLAKEYPKEGKLLNSLKLLGNEAAHSDQISEEDLLNAFEIKEFVLDIFRRIKNEKKVQETADKLMTKFEKNPNNK